MTSRFIPDTSGLTFYVITPYVLAMHVLPIIHFFDRALPEPSAALAASPAVISIFIWRLGQSLFICPNSPHAKRLILLASHCYYCCYGYGYGYGSPCTLVFLSAASTIFPRSIGT